LFNYNRINRLDLTKQEKNLAEQKETFDETIKKIDNDIDSLEKIRYEINVGSEKIKQEQITFNKIKQQQQKTSQETPAKLIPITVSGQPVIQPGLIPIDPSIAKPTVVKCSGAPVIQSGISPTCCSGVMVNTSGLSGFYQSGVF
jgi:hypothetical protein